MNHTIAILAATAALTSPPSSMYTTLGKSHLPCNRILNGLWQTSGGWGEIKQEPAVEALVTLSKNGFQTFDGADHYGPSEVLMGLARESLSSPHTVGGAEAGGGIFFTKWCPSPRAYTPAEVGAAVDKSRSRMRTPTLDLLQLHWWQYAQREELRGVLEALRGLQAEGKVRELGLTNFDSAHVVWMVDQLNLPIASNQVQFSLVDSRPLARMSPACEARGVKLLTYGTLLGGLLSDKYLGKPEPTKGQLSTPSLGKYYNMIRQWGDWPLFQTLLTTCRAVADRHTQSNATIATVAIAWVLRQQAVGGVIVGLRAGLSEHSEENSRALRLAEQLTGEDLAELTAASKRGRDLLAAIGDCGDEYRG